MFGAPLGGGSWWWPTWKAAFARRLATLGEEFMVERIVPGRFGLTITGIARSVLGRTGATVLRVQVPDGDTGEKCSRKGLTIATDARAIKGRRVAGSPGRRVAGSPGRRVA